MKRTSSRGFNQCHCETLMSMFSSFCIGLSHSWMCTTYNISKEFQKSFWKSWKIPLVFTHPVIPNNPKFKSHFTPKGNLSYFCEKTMDIRPIIIFLGKWTIDAWNKFYTWSHPKIFIFASVISVSFQGCHTPMLRWTWW